jgi:APA family basic amino acid/polyamine antiporter
VDHGQEEVTAARGAALASEPAAGPARFQQGIGLLDATTLVVGSMIGSGIFIVSAQSSRVVGSPGWLLMAWAIAGILTMMASVSCAELAAMLPKAGGQYVFFREAYGSLFGFLFGWTMFLVVQTGTIAAVSVAFAKFLGVLWPAISAGNKLFTIGSFSVSSLQAVALAVIAALTASNATGLKAGTRIQNVMTFAKFAALFGLTALGLALGHSGSFAGGAPGFWKAVSQSGGELTGLALVAAVATAMVGPMFAQSAWNNVTFAGEEIRNPGWTLPRALLLGCLLVTTIYVVANVAYLNVLSFSEIQQAPEDRVATAAATSLFGPGAAAVMAAAIMVSTFGCVNGLILSGARVSFAMARDGFFFRGLQRLNSSAVPGNALWAQAFWSGVLVLSGSYTALFTYVISVDILFFVLLVLAVIVLRVKHPEWPRPFRAPLYPYLPLLYAAVGAALIVILLRGNPKTTWPGYAIVMSGIPIYFFWRRK